jgi:beta-RFAP synthase
MPQAVHVSAPSRLHFGMLSFGHQDQRQFGGVGVMIDSPRLELVCRRSEQFSAIGPLAQRVAVFAKRCARAAFQLDEPACQIEILSAPPQHVGLGVGTQLGLSVAAAVTTLGGRPGLDSTELATLVGRAQRSAVGTYGFGQGGLIVEAGKTSDSPVSPLVTRVELPAAWRFVLIGSNQPPGLSGDAEQQAFDQLPPVPAEVTEQLTDEIDESLVPAARSGDFEPFSASLYRYGHAAGNCFASRQGGPYAGPRLCRQIDRLRELGVQGVGQTSWGPTLFALLDSQASAEQLIERLRSDQEFDGAAFSIAAPDNTGARIRVES